MTHTFRNLWKHLENIAGLLDSAAVCMLEMSTDDDTQYLATKRLLISPQWKFAHQCVVAMDDIPIVNVTGGNQLQPSLSVHLPGTVLLCNLHQRAPLSFFTIDVLLYLGEALLQLVVEFYTNLFRPHSTSDCEYSTSKKMLAALLVG